MLCKKTENYNKRGKKKTLVLTLKRRGWGGFLYIYLLLFFYLLPQYAILPLKKRRGHIQKYTINQILNKQIISFPFRNFKTKNLIKQIRTIKRKKKSETKISFFKQRFLINQQRLVSKHLYNVYLKNNNNFLLIKMYLKKPKKTWFIFASLHFL